MLNQSISEDAAKKLADFPSYSNAKFELFTDGSSISKYNVVVALEDERSFPILLEYDEWPGKCPTFQEIPDELILSHIHLIDIGSQRLPRTSILRFMQIVYTELNQDNSVLLSRISSDEAVEVLKSSMESYENVEEAFYSEFPEEEYFIAINPEGDNVKVWIEYIPLLNGENYSTMTDTQIVDSFYLVQASYEQ